MHTHPQPGTVHSITMNNIMNMRRPSRFGASQPAPKVMPTISDVSSDNSEGGAPLHEGLTFSQMKMNQAARNRVQREAVTAAGEDSKPTDNHVPDRRPNGAHASVAAPLPVTKQLNADNGGKAHKLNPASDMFIPSSTTYNDLTKIKVSLHPAILQDSTITSPLSYEFHIHPHMSPTTNPHA